MDGLISIAAILLGAGVAGGAIGLADRAAFQPRWLALALLLILAEDALLTNVYGLVPSLVPGTYNWQGKGVALLALLGIAAHPMFGWAKVGLTWKQNPGSIRACLPVVALYLAVFLAIAILFPDGPSTAEDFAFQLTMPGLEEELFYRGLLLFALNEAFRSRFRLFGVDWGWGALLTSVLFGLAHAFGYADGSFSFDPLYFALTAGPAMLAVWLRERSGSLLLPLLVHNAGNVLPMLI